MLWVEWGIAYYPFMLPLHKRGCYKDFDFPTIKTSRNGKDANVKSSVGVLRPLGVEEGLNINSAFLKCSSLIDVALYFSCIAEG